MPSLAVLLKALEDVAQTENLGDGMMKVTCTDGQAYCILIGQYRAIVQNRDWEQKICSRNDDDRTSLDTIFPPLPCGGEDDIEVVREFGIAFLTKLFSRQEIFGDQAVNARRRGQRR